MNIQEKIIELKALLRFSKEQHPYLNEIFFTINDVPLDELRTYASENKLGFEMSKYDQRFRTHVHFNGGCVALVSRKVKAINPTEVVYEEVFDEQYRDQAVAMVKEHAQSFRH